MPQFHLEVARSRLRQLKADRLFNRPIGEKELTAISKINEVLNLLREAQLILATVDEEKQEGLE